MSEDGAVIVGGLVAGVAGFFVHNIPGMFVLYATLINIALLVFCCSLLTFVSTGSKHG